MSSCLQIDFWPNPRFKRSENCPKRAAFTTRQRAMGALLFPKLFSRLFSQVLRGKDVTAQKLHFGWEGTGRTSSRTSSKDANGEEIGYPPLR